MDYYLIQSSFDGGGWANAGSVNDPTSGTHATFRDNIRREADYVQYRVSAHNPGGYGAYSNETEPIYLSGGGGPESADATYIQLPKVLTLDQNYPNPFNPDTQIRFGLPSASQVSLRILNTRGETVRIIVDDELRAGWHTLTWDGKNTSGQAVGSGIYLYYLEAEGKKMIKKMTLIR